MKILFLDIDGVLNMFGESFRSFKRDSNPLEDILIRRLEYILENVPNLNVVISSSWRQDELISSLLKYEFKYINRIIGRTPRAYQDGFNENTKTYIVKRSNRGEQIAAYLDEIKEETNIIKYLVIDDEIYDIVERSEPCIPIEHVFEIDMNEGLSNKDVLLCIDYFNDPNFDDLNKILIGINKEFDTVYKMDEFYKYLNLPEAKKYITSTGKNIKSTIVRIIRGSSKNDDRYYYYEEKGQILDLLKTKYNKEKDVYSFKENGN